jgi:hypothetical protein
MSKAPKASFTGVLKRKLVNQGSKSEHQAIVLELADGSDLRLRVQGGNPFQNDALKSYLGKRVQINGTTTPAQPLLTIDSVADIIVLGPPGKPARPPQP